MRGLGGKQLSYRSGPIGSPSVVDLFAGPGGLGEGFRQAGFFIAAAVDNDEYAYQTLSLNAKQTGNLVLKENVRKLRMSGNVDVVVGGPPCQGFSNVGIPKIRHQRLTEEGKKRVRDPRRTLYKEFVRIVGDVKPQFFVMENVPTILSFREGKVKEAIIEEFKGIGYETVPVVLNAARYGVPQIRKRAFFIGNRMKVKNPVPTPTNMDWEAEPQLKLGETTHPLPDYLNVGDAISDLPPLEPGGGLDEVPYPPTSGLTPYQARVRTGSPMLYNHVARNHSERDRNVFRILKVGEKMGDLPEKLRPPYRTDIFADRIKKQGWHRPSSTILSHMQKDGLMYVHPDPSQARTFTPREAARLQSFPDWYRFCGPMTQQFKQIGNAVPPILAKHIAEAIKPFLSPVERPVINAEVLTV
ncbi:MAG: DNA cytosine methyltransferase [archaeon]|nr:MAG: DNA cytosine methyltransferase [archaeon]